MLSHKGQSTTRRYSTSQDESEPSALGAWWVRKLQSNSEGYSALSFLRAWCRYISLPKAFNQSTQLVPRAGGDRWVLFSLEFDKVGELFFFCHFLNAGSKGEWEGGSDRRCCDFLDGCGLGGQGDIWHMQWRLV
jgi:hypothetical protein